MPFKLHEKFFPGEEIFKGFKPDAVIGVGGYSSFPVLRYAQAKEYPTFIHESNSFAGKSNILLGQKSDEEYLLQRRNGKVFSGAEDNGDRNPIRHNIAWVL